MAPRGQPANEDTTRGHKKTFAFELRKKKFSQQEVIAGPRETSEENEGVGRQCCDPLQCACHNDNDQSGPCKESGPDRVSGKDKEKPIQTASHQEKEQTSETKRHIVRKGKLSGREVYYITCFDLECQC